VKDFDRRVQKGKMTDAEKEATLKKLRRRSSWKTWKVRFRNRGRFGKDYSEKRNLQEARRGGPQRDHSCEQYSSISITRMASATKRPDRVIGMHFFNPAPVMKLLEIVRGLSFG